MNRLLLLALLLAAAVAPALSATVSGVMIADTAAVDGQKLVLNGAGKRTRFFFDAYVAALYLPARTADAPAVLSLAGPKRLSMTLMRNLSASTVTDALREDIGRNSTPAQIAAIRGALDSLDATIDAIGKARTGDVLTIDFLPDGATQAGLNGGALGKPIPGADFQRALLQIWLGGNPVQEDLKRELLGG